MTSARNGTAPGRPGVGHPAAMWLVAFAFVVTMLGTTLPTPLYPLYQNRFGFSGLTVTVIYAVYAVGVVAALLLFGSWSDQIGRRRMLLSGLVLSGLSAMVFLFAGGLPMLLVGRLLSGLSVAIFAGTATAALVDLAAPGRQHRASLLAAGANTGGLGAGPLLSGVLSQYASQPLRLCFLVDLALVALAGIGVARIPEPVAIGRRIRPRLQRLRVPAQVRGAFLRAGLAGFAGFAVLGLFAAVSAAFLAQVLHAHNHALTGVVAFAAFNASTLGQIASATMAERRALSVGCLGLAAGAGLVAASLSAASLPLLVAGALACGLAHGLVFRAGLTMVTAGSPVGQRAEVASSLFVTLYIGISIPVIGLGAAADRFGLLRAGIGFAALFGTLALAAFFSLLRPATAAAPVQGEWDA
jgi:predicted MFS family arabinose efflux permease